MNHNRVVQLIALICMVACLVGAGFVSQRVDALRDAPRRLIGNKVAEVLPPDKAFLTIGLSVCRGIAIDILWYRANALKEEGKFYEANELSEWITSLQPHFTKVWVFHAWNMAFNISVMTKTPDERWDWINRGISLLRDRGIPLNPQSAEMYKELDWIYFFKIGGFTDDDNWYYKQHLALEWEEVLGPQPEGLTTAQTAKEFAKIALPQLPKDAPADTPDNMATLIAANPGVPIPELLDRLKAVRLVALENKPLDINDPDQRLAFDQEVSRIQMFAESSGAALAGFSLTHPPPGVNAQLCALRADPKLAPAFEPFMRFIRRTVLREHYKLDTAFMLDLMKTYGPLDWRHSAAQALYWSSMATRISEETEKRTGIIRQKDVDLLNAYRGPIHCMQDLMYRGRITFDPLLNPPRMEELPDPRFIPAYDTALDKVNEYLKEIRPGEDLNTSSSFVDGHANFLQTAVQFCYLYGDPDQAQFYYDKLKRLYSKTYPHRFDKNLEDFIHENMVNNMDTYFNTVQFIQAMVLQALERGLANNRPQVYDRFIELARVAHKKWNDIREINSSRQDMDRDRQKLLPFDQIVTEIYVNYMISPGVDPLTRAELWTATPDDMRRRVYDRVQEKARLAAKNMGLDPDRAFPEPPGMAEYRKAHPVQQAGQQVEGSSSDPTQRTHTERQ